MQPPSLLTSCVTVAAVLMAFATTARGDDVPAPTPPSASTAAPAEALRVHVRGGLDAAPVAAAIAAELGIATVVVDTDAACTAPCVAIVVDDHARASIVVVLSTATQQRVIDLPAGPAGAAEVVALVVGNLARDQAAALLADLAQPASMPEAAPTLAPTPPFVDTLGADAPAEPAAEPPPSPSPAVVAPAAPAVAPSRQPETTHFGFGLIPVLSFDVSRKGGKGGVAIDLIIGGRRRLAAFNVSGVGSIVTQDLTGTQIGGAFAAAGRVDGAQIGGAVAVAGTVRGTQIAGALAVAREIRGVQIGGAVAISERSASAQIAGAATLTRGAAGAQVAGALAVAGGDVGTQIAGAVNVAGGRVRGIQIAGSLNVARHVRGTQIAGAVNVAGRVDGVQVGVVNIAGGGDGVSIGLLNLVRGGRTELEGTIDNRGLGTVVLRHGSRRWHNVYGVGGHADSALVDRDVSDRDVWMYGLGMGPSWQRGRTTIDVEAMSWHVVYGGDFTSEVDLLNQLRVVVGYPIGPATLVVGGAVNAYVTTHETRDGITAVPRMTTPGLDDDRAVRVQVWPSAFVGLRL